MSILFLIIIAFLYCCLPWYIGLACFIVNLFFPDPIPFLDELLMFVPVIRKIIRIATLSEFLEEHWKKILVIILSVITAIVAYFIFIK